MQEKITIGTMGFILLKGGGTKVFMLKNFRN